MGKKGGRVKERENEEWRERRGRGKEGKMEEIGRGK